MFIQTPRRVPSIDEWVAHGQQMIDKGSLTNGEWLTVQYTHEGVEYRQRHVRVQVDKTPAIVTLQCRADAFALVEDAQHALVDAIVPSAAVRPRVKRRGVSRRARQRGTTE